VEVRVAGDTRCPRCAGRLCLTASIGQGVHPAAPQGRGRERTLALCQTCDALNPSAQPLLAYFAEHGSVQAQDMAQVSELLGHWLGSVNAEQPEPTLAAQAEAWWTAYVSGRPGAG
jgi:hypothetical protein